MIRKIFLLVVLLYPFTLAQFLGPKISVQQTEYKFGDLEAGKIMTHYFILTNTGDDVLLIKKVHASCGCTVAKPEKDKLSPGESTKLKVEFNSAGRKGPQNKIITVNTNDSKNPDLKLKISGNVVTPSGEANSNGNASLFFPELSHDFGVVKEGTVAEHTFKFTNKGKSTLEISDVRTSCGCTAALLSSKKIEPGKDGTIKVEFDTKNRNGKTSRTITVVSNDLEEPNKILTISADIHK